MVKAVIMIVIVGYFIGCIHGSKVAQILSGVDLKKAGHGNAGASNATLSLGWKYGVLVALIDIGKGVIAIIGAHLYFGDAAFLTALKTPSIFTAPSNLLTWHLQPTAKNTGINHNHTAIHSLDSCITKSKDR